MKDDEADDGHDEDHLEDEEDEDDLLDALVVAAVRSSCKYDTEEEDREDIEEIHNDQQPTMHSSEKRKRKPARKLEWIDENGCHHPFRPKSSLWYCIYVAHPHLDNASFHKRFRIRFRRPYAQFTEQVASLEIEGMFSRWHVGSVSCIKKEATPILRLVLCSLRYLGRGWTFDDLWENTAISIEVIRTFFHLFISYGSTVLYNKYVRSPLRSTDASVHM